MRTLVLGGLLASAMLVPALAQTNPPPASPAPVPSLLLRKPMARCGDHRSSSASTSTTIRTRSSAPSAKFYRQVWKGRFRLIGVGGFLGIGQHDIMVEMSELKFVDEPVRTSSTTTSTIGSATTGTANRPATTTTNRPPTTTTTTATKSKWYPDHAVLTHDQGLT